MFCSSLGVCARLSQVAGIVTERERGCQREGEATRGGEFYF